MQVVHAVGGDRQVLRLGQAGDLEPDRDAAAVRQIGLRVRDPAGLDPLRGSSVTNLSRSAKRVTKFFNARGTAEQWIKEGKNAINWTRVRRTYARPLDGRSRLTLSRLPQQRGSAPASRPGLQSGQLHADFGLAEGVGPLVSDDATGEVCLNDEKLGRMDLRIRPN